MENDHQPTPGDSPHSPFPLTLWSVVIEASNTDSPRSSDALARLCEIYHQPILSWLRRRGVSTTEAEDVTQGFVQHLLEQNRLKHFTRGAAKFRSFLLECLIRFNRDEWRRQTAEKRGGGQKPVDLSEIDPGITIELDEILDLDCAKAAHHTALTRLGSGKYSQVPHAARFEVLRQFIWGVDEDVSYGEVGERLKMTANHMRKAVHDLRHDYHRAFRGVVADSVKPELVDEETEYLIRLLAKYGGVSMP